MKRLLVILMTLCMFLPASAVCGFAAEEEVKEEVVWQHETTVPITGECTVSSVGNKIYVIGSDGSVQIYDTKLKEWSTGSAMPTKRPYTSSCTVGNKIYVIGGQKSNAGTTEMDIYDTDTNTWTRGKPMSLKRWEPILAVLENKVYVMGGQDGASTLSTVEIYDTENEQWSSGVPMPNRIAAGDSIVAGKNIYIFGGGVYDNSWKMTDVVECFNTETGTWGVETRMPTQEGLVTATSVGNKIYVLGDSTPYSILSKDVGIYDLSTKEWEAGPSLITSRCTNESLYIDGKLYIAGGYKAVSPNIASETIESLQIVPKTSDSTLSVLLNIDEQVQLSVAHDLTRNKELTWSSTKEDVVSVDENGKVTAVAEGFAYINARNTEGTFDESIPIRVFPGNADTFRLAVSLNTNEKVKLYLSDENVTWTSLDESIVTVTDSGEVTAIGKGLAIIEATLEGKSQQIYVRVNNATS